MFPLAGSSHPCMGGFPHAGGDVSSVICPFTLCFGFSPRRWGCFLLLPCTYRLIPVFPTQVGMFPERTVVLLRDEGFPHAGGDVSVAELSQLFPSRFSPRRWGCFPERQLLDRGARVFPTQVGMFLWPFAHCWASIRVFPTQVGMFLRCWHGERWRQQFSPRRWGCFFRFLVGQVTASVFPTQVGMFRKARRP